MPKKKLAEDGTPIEPKPKAPRKKPEPKAEIEPAPIKEPEPTPEPEPEPEVSPPFLPPLIEGGIPHVPRGTYIPPLEYQMNSVLFLYQRDFKNLTSSIASVCHVYGIGGLLALVSEQISRLRESAINPNLFDDGAVYVAIRKMAVHAVIGILYLDGQTTLKRFKDEQGVMAIGDYFKKLPQDEVGHMIGWLQRQKHIGGAKAVVGGLMQTFLRLEQIYLRRGSGVRCAYDDRHYLDRPEAIDLRDRLVDFLEECLMLQAVLHQNRKGVTQDEDRDD